MKKRFFNALILGAVLLSTGAVTSCKDYDDDIQNLQEQVNKLSQLESLKTDVATLQSAVKTAQDDATKALADAKAASDKADKAATADQVKAVQAAIDAANELIAKKADKTEVEDLQKLVKEYKDNLDKLSADAATMLEDALKKYALASEVAELKKQVDAITNPEEGGPEDLKSLTAKYNTLKAQAEDLGIAVSSMITGIELFGTVHENAHSLSKPCDHTLTFTTTAEVDNVFEAKDGTKIEFKKGNWATYGDSIVVRVTPVDANLTKEMISLINSQGAVLEDVEVESVERFNTLLSAQRPTRAAAQNTGLWTIKFNLAKDYDAKAFEAATLFNKNKYSNKTESDKVLFAVAVDAKVDADVLKDKDASRSVVSEFDLDMAVQNGVYAKDFSVNNTQISAIHNRFSKTEGGKETDDAKDYTWKESVTGKFSTPAVAYDADNDDATKINVYTKAEQKNKTYGYAGSPNVLVSDNRQDKELLAVEVGTPIVIDYSYVKENNGYYTEGQKVAGFIVTLDGDHALESGVSEINAWDSYTIDGLNTIQGVDENGMPTNKGQITIQDLKNVKGDIIGFRVYAVNLDGTLVDPDGRAFYVAVGNVASEGNLVEAQNVDIKIMGTTAWSDFMPLATDLNVGEFMSKWEASEDNAKYNASGSRTKDGTIASPAFEVHFYTEAKADKELTLEPDGTLSKANRAKAKFVRFKVDATKYIDGETYTQTATLYNKADDKVTKLVEKTITATFTKVMPTDVPAYAFLPFQQLDANNNPSSEVDYTTGKFRAYLVPENGYDVTTPSTKGTLQMSNILYNGLGEGFSFQNMSFTFKKATADKKKDLEPVIGLGEAKIPAVHADNKSEFTVAVDYVYRHISNAWDAEKKAWVSYEEESSNAGDYTVASDKNLTAIFACWHSASTFDWATDKVADGEDDEGNTKYKDVYRKPALKWGIADITETKTSFIDEKNSYNATLFNGRLSELLSKKYLKIKDGSAKLTYANQKDPYFKPVFDLANGTINFVQTQTTNAPAVDHEENLEFVLIDSFGHELKVSLPVTIKKP